MSTTSILIRDLPIETKHALQALASKHGQSMAQEARVILNRAAARAAKQLGEQIKQTQELEQLSVGHRIHARFKAIGGVELNLPPRSKSGRPIPDFSVKAMNKKR